MRLTKHETNSIKFNKNHKGVVEQPKIQKRFIKVLLSNQRFKWYTWVKSPFQKKSDAQEKYLAKEAIEWLTKPRKIKKPKSKNL